MNFDGCFWDLFSEIWNDEGDLKESNKFQCFMCYSAITLFVLVKKKRERRGKASLYVTDKPKPTAEFFTLSCFFLFSFFFSWRKKWLKHFPGAKLLLRNPTILHLFSSGYKKARKTRVYPEIKKLGGKWKTRSLPGFQKESLLKHPFLSFLLFPRNFFTSGSGNLFRSNRRLLFFFRGAAFLVCLSSRMN